MMSSEEYDGLSEREKRNNKQELLDEVILVVSEIVKEVSDDIAKFISDIIKRKFSNLNEMANEKRERESLLKQNKKQILIREEQMTEEELLEGIALSGRITKYLREETDIQSSKITKFNVYFTNYAGRSLKLLRESFEWQYLWMGQRVLLKEKTLEEYKNICRDNGYASEFLRTDHEKMMKRWFENNDGKIINSMLNREKYKLDVMIYEKEEFFRGFILEKNTKVEELVRPNHASYFNKDNDYICKLEADLKQGEEELYSQVNDLIKSLSDDIIDDFDRLTDDEKKGIPELLKLAEMLIREIEDTGRCVPDSLLEKVELLKNLILNQNDIE